MIHHFKATFQLNGVNQTPMEMTYDDTDITATLKRRLTTAFPNATNITIERTENPQTDLLAKRK